MHGLSLTLQDYRASVVIGMITKPKFDAKSTKEDWLEVSKTCPVDLDSGNQAVNYSDVWLWFEQGEY